MLHMLKLSATHMLPCNVDATRSLPYADGHAERHPRFRYDSWYASTIGSVRADDIPAARVLTPQVAADRPRAAPSLNSGPLGPLRFRWRIIRADLYTLAARACIWPLRRGRPLMLRAIIVAAHAAAAAQRLGWSARTALRRPVRDEGAVEVYEGSNWHLY
jgi:hypothetical protein